MAMTIYKLYGTGDGESISSVDVQMDGIIQSLMMTGYCTGADALNDGFFAELSFLSSNSKTSSDTRGSLMIIQSLFGLLTSGGFNSGVNMGVSSLEIPVAAGERVHLHISQLGGITAAFVHAFMYVRDKGTVRAAGRRR